MAKRNGPDNNVALESLKAICEGISEHRARELLEASNGSLERAIDIFFHQREEQEQDQEESEIEPSKKRSSAPQNRSAKQARLDAFFQTESENKKGTTDSSRTPMGKSNSKKKEEISRNNSTGIEVIVVDDDSPVKILNVDVPHEDEENTASAGSESRTKPVSAVTIPAVHEIDKNEDHPAILSKKKATQSVMPKKIVAPRETVKPEVSFQRLSETLQQMADTTKRLVKLDVLEKYIRDIIAHAEEPEKTVILTYALQLVLGLRTSTDQPALDVSGSAVSKSLQTILGVSRMQLSKAYRQYGDLGDSAASFFQKKTTFFVTTVRELSIVKVYQSLQDIVAADGRDAKQHILFQLMRSCQTKTELRFLVRLLIGNMRVGANLKTILAALAMAIGTNQDNNLDIKGAVQLIQKTHDVCPNLEKIIGALLAGGFEQMKQDCGIQVLTPIAPMLAHPVHSLEQVEKVMHEKKNSAVMEWKYDGVRCQAHYDGATIKLFSRHMLETTAQYPDAAKSFLDAIKEDRNVQSFIIDSEIVGVEEEGDQIRLLPFQDLSRRKRKNDDGQGVRVKVFAFDLVYLNGISFVDRPLWERQQTFRDYFKETKDYAHVSSQILPSYEGTQIKEFLEEAIRSGAEGLMVKMLGKYEAENVTQLPQVDSSTENSPYEAGTRSHNWLKVKRDYVAGYADTIDVVPIGAWYGSGRKAQKSFLSPVLLAVYDEEDDVYRSISRCMTFTDDMYEAMREFYFRGTSYPSDGCIEEEHDTYDGNTKTDLDTCGVSDMGRGDESDSDEKSIDGDSTGQSDSFGDGKDMVNCYPNRPSSAFVITNESPPIWFKPLEVFEVSFADMTLSRQHTAAAGLIDDQEGRGVALRFPRFKRRRPDKRPDQATTTSQIAQLFAKQSKQGSFATRTSISK